jgi:hypothetical protein
MMYVAKHLWCSYLVFVYPRASIIAKADRTEPYTRITPFQEKHDTSVEFVFPAVAELINVHYPSRFFYKPVTLSALSVGLGALAYVAMTQDVLEEGRDKRRVYVCLLVHLCKF